MRLISEDALAVANIWAEARGEPFEGKCAVGEVVRERMRRKYMSDGTVSGTIFRAFQFSWTNPTDPNRVHALSIDDDDPVVQECARAWKESETSHYARGAVLYYAPAGVPKPPPWATPEKLAVVLGAHQFFQD